MAKEAQPSVKPTPLGGDLTIVDLSSGIAGAYCGKLLVDGGADVIKGVMLLVAERWVAEPRADYRALICEHFDLVMAMATPAAPASTGRGRRVDDTDRAASSRRRPSPQS